MPDTGLKFELKFDRLPDLAMEVAGFTGEAELNSLYVLEIAVLANASDLGKAKAADLFGSKATFSVSSETVKEKSEKGRPQAFDAAWHGVLLGFHTEGSIGDKALAVFRLGPELSALKGQVQNRIHLNLSSPDIIKDSISFGGVDPAKLKVKTNPSRHPAREFVFQHEEDMLDFVFRTMEREGLSLHFDQTGGADDMVLSDSNVEFQDLLYKDEGLRLGWAPVSGLRPSGGALQLFDWSSEESVPPKTLRLRDYNWKAPNRPLEVTLDVSPYGRGELYLYGENFETAEEGQRLGNIRREELLSRARRMSGLCNVPGMMPGRAFTLEGHPDPERNGRHVVVKATCEGRPEFSGASGLGGGGGLLDSLAGRPSGFSARIVFQKADVPFRPERRMPDPKIGGTVTAWIDGAGSGESPEMDSVGRYKVLLPLDASGRGGGSASHWIRMAQPYVGKGYGQNFPLTPGAEVLLSFVDGNPDRPVIAGAVPNGETGGLINGSASNRAGVGTRGGSSLVFGNDPGSQSVALDSGSRRGSVSLSANSPTTALIEADKLTVFTGIDNELFGLGVGRHVGMEYEVTATTRILNSVKAAALDALAAEKHMSGEVKSGGGSGYNEGGGLGGDEGDSGGGGGSGGSGGGGDGGGSPFFALAKNAGTLALTGGGNLYAIGEALKYMFTAYNPLQVPHRHLVHLSADSNGSRGFLRSKTRESLSAIRVLSLLNNTLTSIGATTEAVVNAKDLEENMPDDKNDRTNKILAVATQEATDLRVVVSQLAALIGTAVFTPEGGGETRGVVVENSDSYTDIYGKSALSVSSNGPVVVESSGSQVGELSRTHPFHLSIPEHLTRRESSPESAGFGSNKAVLLRSELVKALAGCIIMGAKECVYSKALYSMQFQVGANAAPPPPAASPALTDPLLNASLERINQEKVNIDAEQLEQGMLFRTNSANVPVHVETTGPDSPIELIQGKGGATEGSLTLDGEGCSLKAGDSLSLTLGSGGGPSARLSQSEEAFLGLDPSKAVLQQADGSALSIEGGSIKCQSPAGATIEAGASSVEVTPASVVFKGTSLNVDGRIIRLC